MNSRTHKNIGHRLSGSEAYEKSTMGCQNFVMPEQTKYGFRSHDSGLGKRKESLHIKTSNGNWKSLKMLSLGNSEGTGGKDVSGKYHGKIDGRI
jgi:hypothetical protein